MVSNRVAGQHKGQQAGLPLPATQSWQMSVAPPCPHSAYKTSFNHPPIPSTQPNAATHPVLTLR